MNASPLSILVASLATALATMGTPASAQVKVFDRVPTVEELQNAMPAKKASPRTRGLTWTVAPMTDSGGGGSAVVAAASPSAAVAATATTATTAATDAAAAPQTQGVVALPINFEPNSSRLTPQGAAYLEPVAQLLKKDMSLRMAVEGHTDAAGSSNRNLVLSWDRAMTVFKLLVERHGIEPVRLMPVGKGSSEPLDELNPEAANNRRVQFRPLG